MKDVITAWLEDVEERHDSGAMSDEQYGENLSWMAYLLTNGME